MFFRYWKEDGKATVVEDVDRLVYDSPEKLQFRMNRAGRYDWVNLRYGIDYLRFAMTND